MTKSEDRDARVMTVSSAVRILPLFFAAACVCASAFANPHARYPYFKKMYFDAKGGSSNLNLVTSGLEENASTSAANDMGFLAGFLEKKTLSFQTILRRLEQSSGRSGPYLYGVSGDEQNTWQP